MILILSELGFAFGTRKMSEFGISESEIRHTSGRGLHFSQANSEVTIPFGQGGGCSLKPVAAEVTHVNDVSIHFRGKVLCLR